MNTPILSIITTIYNCEKYLRESLDSILSQSFKDFQLILVNDGSTDKTRDIAREFTDKNIKKVIYIGYSENKKIPMRRNQGIEITTSQLKKSSLNLTLTHLSQDKTSING